MGEARVCHPRARPAEWLQPLVCPLQGATVTSGCGWLRKPQQATPLARFLHLPLIGTYSVQSDIPLDILSSSGHAGEDKGKPVRKAGTQSHRSKGVTT
jgi:hypothetical protein